MIITSTTVTR